MGFRPFVPQGQALILGFIYIYIYGIFSHSIPFGLCLALPDIQIHTLVKFFELDTYIFDNLLFSTFWLSFILYTNPVKKL